ncbi:hypothetical protein BESB_029840 [Besnoitia besnoiti]|uniref:Uncharacterized protein n=1 Tax=Besnoitia besnoiti TaxID=94643 RepID=A0A2A9M6S1_BESBE|nr:hypothetical protein BESB_029840 [Besnoitia besnoiti]PFH31110.1 hypothetical protein BESB_029840 [Besnoitia besnoiti]
MLGSNPEKLNYSGRMHPFGSLSGRPFLFRCGALGGDEIQRDLNAGTSAASHDGASGFQARAAKQSKSTSACRRAFHLRKLVVQSPACGLGRVARSESVFLEQKRAAPGAAHGVDPASHAKLANSSAGGRTRATKGAPPLLVVTSEEVKVAEEECETGSVERAPRAELKKNQDVKLAPRPSRPCGESLSCAEKGVNGFQPRPTSGVLARSEERKRTQPQGCLE